MTGVQGSKRKNRVAKESNGVPSAWEGRGASGSRHLAQLGKRVGNAMVKIARNPIVAWRMLWPRYGPFASRTPYPEFRRMSCWSFGALPREPLSDLFPNMPDIHSNVAIGRHTGRQFRRRFTARAQDHSALRRLCRIRLDSLRPLRLHPHRRVPHLRICAFRHPQRPARAESARHDRLVWHDYGMLEDVSRAVDEVARRIKVRSIQGTRLAVRFP